MRSTIGPAVSRIAHVGGDDGDTLVEAPVGGEPLDQLVGVRGEAHLERADPAFLASAVEDDDAAGAAERDVTGEPVDQLVAGAGPARVDEVVAVEEKERRVGHPQASASQRAHAANSSDQPFSDVPEASAWPRGSSTTLT